MSISPLHIDKRIIYRNTLQNMSEATSGNSYYKGTLTSGASKGFIDVAGRRGLDFDGADTTLPVTGVSNSVFQNGFTISAWIYPESIGETTGVVIDKSDDASGTGGFYFRLASSNVIAVRINGGTVRASATSAVPFNQWTHAIATIGSDGTTTIYINGVVSGTPGVSAVLSGITTANPLTIGNRAGATDRTWDGLISDVQVFKGAFTAQEVALLYKNSLYKETVSKSGELLDVHSYDGVISDKTKRYTLTPTSVSTVNYGGVWVNNFDGADSKLVTNLTSNADFQNGFSIEAWIYPRSLGEGSAGYWGRIVDKSDTSAAEATNGFGLWLYQETNLRARINDGTLVSPAVPALFNKWSHIVWTVDASGNSTFYHNAVKVAGPTNQGALSGITTASPVTIGNYSVLQSRTFDGYIGKTRITTKIYTAEEVSNLFNSSRWMFGV